MSAWCMVREDCAHNTLPPLCEQHAAALARTTRCCPCANDMLPHLLKAQCGCLVALLLACHTGARMGRPTHTCCAACSAVCKTCGRACFDQNL
eukprot:351952-Chlamydomonas_euryale.AAC.14